MEFVNKKPVLTLEVMEDGTGTRCTLKVKSSNVLTPPPSFAELPIDEANTQIFTRGTSNPAAMEEITSILTTWTIKQSVYVPEIALAQGTIIEVKRQADVVVRNAVEAVRTVA